MIKLLQHIQNKFPKHKYAIHAALLGDSSECAWSNLGLWQGEESYPQACQNLADYLGQSLHLNSNDHLLDLGVGYGASLLFWQNKYQIKKNIQAVELQNDCVLKLKKQNLKNIQIFHESYLNLKKIPFQNKFDVVVCIDSAYHHALNSFIDALVPVLNSKARIGFHTLVLSERWHTLSSIDKQQYAWLLKLADVNLKNLKTSKELEISLKHAEFKNIRIENLSKSVFFGFSEYVEHRLSKNKNNIDYLKIQMTAKLCKKLFKDGFIDYVQVTAHYK